MPMDFCALSNINWYKIALRKVITQPKFQLKLKQSSLFVTEMINVIIWSTKLMRTHPKCPPTTSWNVESRPVVYSESLWMKSYKEWSLKRKLLRRALIHVVFFNFECFPVVLSCWQVMIFQPWSVKREIFSFSIFALASWEWFEG